MCVCALICESIGGATRTHSHTHICIGIIRTNVVGTHTHTHGPPDNVCDSIKIELLPPRVCVCLIELGPCLPSDGARIDFARLRLGWAEYI